MTIDCLVVTGANCTPLYITVMAILQPAVATTTTATRHNQAGKTVKVKSAQEGIRLNLSGADAAWDVRC